MRRLVLSLVLAACSSPRRPVAPSPELSPALAPLAWWLGDWDGDHGSEHWIAASGAVFGIALGADGGFEILVLDDAPGPGKPDGVLRLYAMPGGQRSVEFRAIKLASTLARFANEAHDFPQAIEYRRDGATLVATISGGGPEQRFAFRRNTMARAPELEAADRAFSDATGARGIAGWVAAFEPTGAMMTKDGRVEGHAAIAALMQDLLASGTLAWAPIASGRRGDLGYTVGKATFTGKDGASWRSVYVTIWRRQPDGTWQVAFDTGRTVN